MESVFPTVVAHCSFFAVVEIVGVDRPILIRQRFEVSKYDALEADFGNSISAESEMQIANQRRSSNDTRRGPFVGQRICNRRQPGLDTRI